LLPFEFFIEGPPVSQQTRRRSRLRAWVAEVRRSAERTWPADGLAFAGAIMITLTYLYDDELDLDNLAKPVLDALKGLVFLDDQQVTDLLVRKRNLTMDLRVEDPSAILAAGLDLGTQFLHVLVEDAPDQGRL
jgi:crossover junction endodeoxyribonuclease RusA